MSQLEPPDPAMTASMSLDGDVDKLRDYYEGWAATYDNDVSSHGYGLPQTMVQTLLDVSHSTDEMAWLRSPSASVVDAGCGTGLVGAALQQAGWTNITGLDLSSEMAQLATERGVYSTVEAGVDLTAPLADHLAGAFDVCTVGGVFTVGHVPPSALSNVASLVRPGGVLIVSVREAYFQEQPYQSVVEDLQAAGRLELLVQDVAAPYTMDSTGRYFGYRVNS